MSAPATRARKKVRPISIPVDPKIEATASPTPTSASPAPNTSTARKSSALKDFCSGKVTGLPVTMPWSLPKAIRLPEKVTAPISVLSTMVAPAPSPSPGPLPPSRTNSAAATAAEAPPPNPLKTATSWGMAVISILRASTPPMTAPAMTAAATVVQSRISLSRRVTTMASSMATEARTFPDRAVAGEDSCLIPETKRIAETRYAS